MNKTSIEWTDRSWNPVSGCSHVSEGCRNCYAEAIAKRFHKSPPWTAQNAHEVVEMHPDKLDEPLRIKKPQKIFVNSMSDLFHENVPFEFIDKVFLAMAICQHHTFKILTKRPGRMREYCGSQDTVVRLFEYSCALVKEAPELQFKITINGTDKLDGIKLPNVWLGVSVEDQKTADERIPILLETPAAIRFVSYEPALGPVDFARVPGLNKAGSAGRNLLDKFWIICGGESGPKARPCNVEWIQSVVKQCKIAGVKVFCKQLGSINRCSHSSKGGHIECFPQDLQIREFPNA